MTLAQDRGRHGEEIATTFLMGLGYEIRGRNVRLMRDEIDIIAFDPEEKMMVFVEVKTRRQNSEAYPIRTSVDRRKKHAMQRAVERWVVAHDYDGPGRMDLICIENETVAEHLKDIGARLY